MGMEPFVAADDNAFGHLIGSIPNPTANLQQALDFKTGLAAKQAEIARAQAQTSELTQKISRAQMFQNDLSAVKANPDAQAVSSLIMKYPEFAEQIKSGWDVKDNASKQADLTQLGEVYSAAASGNWSLALKQAQARVDADKAAGKADPEDQAFVDQITAAEGGDENARKGVLTTLGTHIAAVSGPEHFATVYGALKGGYTLDPGAVRIDENGNMVAHSPLVKDAEGNLYPWAALGMGGEAGPNGGSHPLAGVSPAASSVATTLASSGLPAPVIAGFMGNFHAEGGWNGAQGDGGSASGIGQWRDQRAANFEKIIGKPATEATPAEQAQFVAWEMKNPQAAGMTVGQRDAIMSAQTPAQAAALIDKFYERSDGSARKSRMAAANAFATASGEAPSATQVDTGPRPLLPAKPKDPPSGYRFKADGSLEAIPGGPADKTGGVALAPGNTDLSGPDYIGDLRKTNPSLASQVQGVLDTRLAYPPATARTPQAQQLRAAVLQADPTYDEQAYKRRQTTIQQYTPGHAGPGQSMLSAATLINHMYDLAQAARELPDHTTAAQNAVSAWMAKQTNQQWLIKYNEGRKFVASELPKFLEGKAPTEGQVSQHYDSYSPTKGKSGIQAALSTDVDYLYGRYQPLLQAYKDNVGKDLKLDTYAPGQVTAAKAAALEYYRANGALPMVVSNPAQAAKLPHGAIFATPDGRVLRRH